MATPTPAGWYADPESPGQYRYWDGQAWTQHTAPASAPPPSAETASAQETPCPYCGEPVRVDATRCRHCSGELRYCPRCHKQVAVREKKKFVGIARGVTQIQLRCRKCNEMLEGPRW
jgi:hypothetical protein